MTVWVVTFSEDYGNWWIEKICKDKNAAIAYCEKMNKDLIYPFYSYAEYEVE